MNIIFGTKKLTESTKSAIEEKYADIPVVTIEGQKGYKKARRILFNRLASELLNLEQGTIQELVFAPIADTNELLITNLDSIPQEGRGDMNVFKTSKNKVSYSEETTEKGKSITSSNWCKEIFSFLGGNDTSNLELKLRSFDSEDIEAYYLDSMNKEVEDSIELNSGLELNTEEVVESVQDAVLRSEEEFSTNDPAYYPEEAAPLEQDLSSVEVEAEAVEEDDFSFSISRS